MLLAARCRFLFHGATEERACWIPHLFLAFSLGVFFFFSISPARWVFLYRNEQIRRQNSSKEAKRLSTVDEKKDLFFVCFVDCDTLVVAIIVYVCVCGRFTEHKASHQSASGSSLSALVVSSHAKCLVPIWVKRWNLYSGARESGSFPNTCVPGSQAFLGLQAGARQQRNT